MLLNSSYTMSNTFNNASMIVNDKTYLDAVIRGLLVQPSESIDTQVDDALWNKLFRYSTIFFKIVLKIARYFMVMLKSSKKLRNREKLTYSNVNSILEQLTKHSDSTLWL